MRLGPGHRRIILCLTKKLDSRDIRRRITVVISPPELDFLNYIVERGSKAASLEVGRQGGKLLHSPDKRWIKSDLGQ